MQELFLKPQSATSVLTCGVTDYAKDRNEKKVPNPSKYFEPNLFKTMGLYKCYNSSSNVKTPLI